MGINKTMDVLSNYDSAILFADSLDMEYLQELSKGDSLRFVSYAYSLGVMRALNLMPKADSIDKAEYFSMLKFFDPEDENINAVDISIQDAKEIVSVFNDKLTISMLCSAYNYGIMNTVDN